MLKSINFFTLTASLLILRLVFNGFTPTIGCTTPVFRYALERWPAYLYEVEVIHTGALNEDQKNALDLLQNQGKYNLMANLKVTERIMDANVPDKGLLPLMRLHYPGEHRNPAVIWEGALSSGNVRKLVDSPARRKAIRNIIKGDAIVWFFLDGGKEELDGSRSALLNNQLALLSKELKLASTAVDVSGKSLEIDTANLSVNFSMVRLSRFDPEEEIFAKILLGTEADLASFDGPLAFPVFGRGRALYALVDRGINPNLIRKTCQAIIGWCSCTVKEENPGTDLLFSANWEKAMGDSSWIRNDTLPEITGLTGFLPAEHEEQDIDSREQEKHVDQVKPALQVVVQKLDPADTMVRRKSEAANNNRKPIPSGEAAVDEPVIELEAKETSEPSRSLLQRNIFLFMGIFILMVAILSFILRKKTLR